MRPAAFLLPCCVYLLLLGSSCSEDPEHGSADSGPLGGGAHEPIHGTDGSLATDGSGIPNGDASAGSPVSDGSSGSADLGGGGGPADTGSNGAPDAGGGGAPDAGGTPCPALASGMDNGPARVVIVDAQQIVGTIRSLQGAHWDPGPAKQGVNLNYVALGVDMIRTHDAGGVNGSGSGDIDGPGRDRIFPNLSADPNNEASYNFGPTDKMIQNIRDTGAEIFFRVGRSNLSGDGKGAVPPDFDKYAEIVKHVVMHYNQGWAKGFTLGIRYFEIWNEPDFIPFWVGTGAQYHELYKKIALAIKAVEPKALVGGPANSTYNDKTGLRATFLKYLNDNKVPLDFYTYHKYTGNSQDPFDFARIARSYREELDKFGFTATQIMNTEFESSLRGDIMLGGDAGHAAFMAEALMYMQDAPVDRAMSYQRFGASASKEGLAFGVLSKLKTTPARLCAQGGDENGFAVLAGRSMANPELQVVIANYQIATSLMGPLPGGTEREIMGSGGRLATMTSPERRTFSYPDKDGYALTIKSIPDAWGDVTIKQYRIDASSSFALVSTKVVKLAERTQGGLTVAGAWKRARANPPDDPMGAPQGVDLVVMTGTAPSQ